jgi:UTP--glucose-1-phosphate uridylyltransferase
MSTRAVRKALIPAAGRGTRFLPLTKSVPKELAPLVTTPAIEFVVAEAAEHGISDVILVTSSDKAAVAQYFQPNDELEAALEKKGDTQGLETVRRGPTLAAVQEVEQSEPLGLGHAVGCGEQFAAGEPIAVLLPDDLIDDRDDLLGPMLAVYAEHGGVVVALLDVGPAEISKYGCAVPAAGADPGGDVVALADMVEKPKPEDAPSTLAIIGRYVLPPEIFPILADTKPGKGGEIQLTDGLATLCERHGLAGLEVEGRRDDVGDRAGYVVAMAHYALKRADIADEVRAGLTRLLAETAANK